MNENERQSVEDLAESLDKPKRRSGRRRSKRAREGTRRRVANFRERQELQKQVTAYCLKWNVISFEQLNAGCSKACLIEDCTHAVLDVADSLKVARLFARAGRAAQASERRFVGKDLSEPHEGETIRQFCERIYHGLTVKEGDEYVEPRLNQTTWKLDDHELIGPKLWESTWVGGEDDVLIDTENLPPLPGEPKVLAIKAIKVGDKYFIEGSDEYKAHLRREEKLLADMRTQNTAQAIQELRGEASAEPNTRSFIPSRW